MSSTHGLRTEQRFNELLCLLAPIQGGLIERFGYLFYSLKPLAGLHPPHFTAPKGGPGLLNFI